MARVDESGQWIVLMGILVSVGLLFLAYILNQSTLVGMTTAESVLDFPKNEIQDLRSEVFEYAARNITGSEEISALARYRKNAEIYFAINKNPIRVGDNYYYPVEIHFNNGVTDYDETLSYYVGPA